MSEEKEALERKKLLQEIEKVRLDTEKLQKDLASYDDRLALDKQRMASDKNRFAWETIRLLGVALITGLISYFTTSMIKDTESRESRKNIQYQNFYADRKKIADKQTNLEKCELACQIKEDYEPRGLPDIQRDLRILDSMCKAKDGLLANIAKASQLDVQVNKTNTPTEVVLNKIDMLENKKKNLEQVASTGAATNNDKSEIRKLNDSLDSLIRTAGITTVSKQSDAITTDFVEKNQAVKNISLEIAPGNTENKMVDGYPKTLWFKEGFFLVFDNMKVFLEKLQVSDESLTVEICKSVTTAPCAKADLITTNAIISKDNPLHFTKGDFEYVIRLDHVGKAGKNPFTKAAYVSFEKYRK